MKELRSKILEALISALPITAIVYILALTPWFDLSQTELITFSIGAVMLVLGIVLGANPFAMVLPLAFARPILLMAEFFRKKGD